MPNPDEELLERARRKGRRGSVSAECLANPNEVSTLERSPQAPLHAGSGLKPVPANPLGPNDEEKHQVQTWLKVHFLFSTIKSEETWSQIFAHMQRMECSQDDTIIEQGSLDADYFYIVISGEFRVWLNGVQVNDVIYTSGSCFGELALMYQCPRQATVKCVVGPGSLWTIDRATFKQVLMRQEYHRGDQYLPILKLNWVFTDNLSESELEKVADVLTSERIEGMNINIINQGDGNLSRMHFYVIIEGDCEVFKGTTKVRTLHRGDYFGERALLEKGPRTASVRSAGGKVELARLDFTNFERLLRKPLTKAFIRRIESGYERNRFTFVVEDRRYPTNIPVLASKRFDSLSSYVSFLASFGEDASQTSSVFWVVDDKYRTSVPWLTGRSFPNIESYLSHIAQMTTSQPLPPPNGQQQEATNSSASSSPQVSPSVAEMLRKGQTIAKKRGRRGSVSGESFSGPDSVIKRGILSSPSPALQDESLRSMLKKQFLFADLAASELDFIMGEMVEQTCKQGDVIITQHDPEADFFYLVKSGEFIVEKDGNLVENVRYGPGSAFGELALMYMCPRAATITCDSESGSLYALNREAFRSVLVGARSSMRDRFETFLKERAPLFESWTKESISKVADVAEEVMFQKGDILIKEGDADINNMKLFFLEKGSVDVQVGTDVVRTIHIGEYFGERAILNRVPRSATCIATTDQVQCLALDVAAFERLLGPLRSVLRGKSRSYVIEMKEAISSMKDGTTRGGAIPKTSVPSGWFRVGNQVFRTSLTQLNGKSFADVEAFTTFLSRPSQNKSSSAASDDSRFLSRRPYSFYVSGQEYRSNLDALRGRTFATVEDFTSFLNMPPVLTSSSPIHGDTLATDGSKSFHHSFDI